MKYIKKGEEPVEFTKWKALPDDNWQPSFNNLQNPQKKIVHNALMQEQGYICCYCERELIEIDSHIEHLLPKDKNKYPEKGLYFSNMLCSCQNKIKKGEPRHCGNLKDNNEIPISPLDKNCENYFQYTHDGYIKSVNENAKITIETLGLNKDKLNALREKAIEPFLDELLTEAELMKFVSAYLKKVDGKYSPFYTTIKFLFGE